MNLDGWRNALLRWPDGLQRRIRVAYWRAMGMRIGERCWLRRIRVDRNPWDIELANEVALDEDVVLLTTGLRGDRPRIAIGPSVYINRYTMVDASARVEIGAHSMIGPHCYITDHDHGSPRHGVVARQALKSAEVSIGSNVWIGAGAIVLKGVTIGDGAVVGAGAVVTRSIPPGALVKGVPAC